MKSSHTTSECDLYEVCKTIDHVGINYTINGFLVIFTCYTWNLHPLFTVSTSRGRDHVSQYVFVDPGASFPLPDSFDFQDYIETERELWALFPETEGKRANFGQVGLTAQIYVEVPHDGSDPAMDETFILMPCADNTMKPIRMKACRRLTLTEYRMGHLTALKLMGKMNEANAVMQQVGREILGEEVLDEVRSRIYRRDEDQDDNF